MDEPVFSHLDEHGKAQMVNVGGKPAQRRSAEAEGRIHMEAATLMALREGRVAKGDALAAARLAGIMAAKRTSEWIPLCHTLPLDHVWVNFEWADDAIWIRAGAGCTGRTGVEMEALTAVSAAALTLYDMCKAVDKTMRIDGVRLVKKEKYDVPESAAAR